MIKELEGIIVSVRDYSETSQIINIITKDNGIVGAIAKGSKSMKSNLRSTTDKLTYGLFNLYYKEDKLSTLTSVDVIDNFKNIKTDIEKISYATFLLELTEQVIKQSENTAIYPLLINALIKINEGYDPMVITNIVELKYLAYLGVMPKLDGCSICDSKVLIKTLSSDLGGYVCANCYKNEVMVDEKTIKLIRMYLYVDIAKISKLDVSDKPKKEINTFLDDYYEKYTGLYLKSKSFLKTLSQL